MHHLNNFIELRSVDQVIACFTAATDELVNNSFDFLKAITWFIIFQPFFKDTDQNVIQ